MSDSYLSDKAGSRINPASDDKLRDIEDSLNLQKALVENLESLLALSVEEDSGKRLTNAAANTDTEVAVTPGLYVFDCVITGGFYFGLADTQTYKNVRWACGLNQRILIKVPDGYFSLHYATTVNDGIGFLRKLA